MNIDELKASLITVLEKVEYDPNVSLTLKEFIETYDGTHVDIFFATMFQAINMLMYVQRLEEKAKGFDKINSANADFEASARAIKQEFERISAGLPPVMPSNLNSGTE